MQGRSFLSPSLQAPQLVALRIPPSLGKHSPLRVLRDELQQSEIEEEDPFINGPKLVDGEACVFEAHVSLCGVGGIHGLWVTREQFQDLLGWFDLIFGRLGLRVCQDARNQLYCD